MTVRDDYMAVVRVGYDDFAFEDANDALEFFRLAQFAVLVGQRDYKDLYRPKKDQAPLVQALHMLRVDLSSPEAEKIEPGESADLA